MSAVDSTSTTSVAQPKYEIRDVPGFPGYRVDTLGQVWSNRYACQRQVAYDPATPYLLLKTPPVKSGHLQVSVQRDGLEHNLRVHYLILVTFVGPRPPGLECRHLDGNPANNRLENLVWGTRKENMDDKKRHGTDGVGERGSRAKLTNDQAREIRQRYVSGGFKQAELAEAYGVSVPVISTIVTGKVYVDAGGPVSPPKTVANLVQLNLKLTDAQVAEIRHRLRQPGVLNKDLAKEYGVSKATISRIRCSQSR